MTKAELCFNTLNGSIYVGTSSRKGCGRWKCCVSIPSTGRFTLEPYSWPARTLRQFKVSIPSTGRFTLEPQQGSDRALNERSFNTLNGSIYVGTRRQRGDARNAFWFQYPQRVDLRWNFDQLDDLPGRVDVSIPSTGRFTLELLGRTGEEYRSGVSIPSTGRFTLEHLVRFSRPLGSHKVSIPSTGRFTLEPAGRQRTSR